MFESQNKFFNSTFIPFISEIEKLSSRKVSFCFSFGGRKTTITAYDKYDKPLVLGYNIDRNTTIEYKGHIDNVNDETPLDAFERFRTLLKFVGGASHQINPLVFKFIGIYKTYCYDKEQNEYKGSLTISFDDAGIGCNIEFPSGAYFRFSENFSRIFYTIYARPKHRWRLFIEDIMKKKDFDIGERYIIEDFGKNVKGFVFP